MTASTPTNDELFDRFTALTFDDVVVVPGYSEVLPADVDTKVHLARDITLGIPVVSAAMDRVTESRMAVGLAREGGIGVIHRNLEIDDQAAEVRRVKRSQSGMITDPVTLGPHATVGDAEDLMARYRFSGVPITSPDGLLLGIITNRDIRFLEPGDERRPVTDFMTGEGLVTARTGTLLEARDVLRRHRIEKLPLVDERGYLTGLITVKDLAKHRDHPYAALDSKGRLRVAAAVGVGPEALKRVDALVNAGVDAVAIDTAHGHSQGVVETIRAIRADHPDLAILAGNVVTAEGVEALASAGADAVKVGVGAGSICTTRVVAGAGMPQLSAIHEASRAAARLGVPVIGDGGITYSGDIVKAVAAGANMVMLGSILAGTDESPGEFELYEGRRFKSYRGMGSLGALSGRANDRYASGQTNSIAAQTGTGKLVPEGVEGRVPYAGTLHDVIHQLVGGLRSGMGYAGAADLAALSRARLMRVTAAGRAESHPHDVQITKEAPNYSRGAR
jgi:IMP dehydrogenase